MISEKDMKTVKQKKRRSAEVQRPEAIYWTFSYDEGYRDALRQVSFSLPCVFCQSAVWLLFK